MYKFNSLLINLLQESTTYERTTYSFLDWLGDVGGLIDGLRLVVCLFIGPVTNFALKATLLS